MRDRRNRTSKYPKSEPRRHNTRSSATTTLGESRCPSQWTHPGRQTGPLTHLKVRPVLAEKLAHVFICLATGRLAAVWKEKLPLRALFCCLRLQRLADRRGLKLQHLAACSKAVQENTDTFGLSRWRRRRRRRRCCCPSNSSTSSSFCSCHTTVATAASPKECHLSSSPTTRSQGARAAAKPTPLQQRDLAGLLTSVRIPPTPLESIRGRERPFPKKRARQTRKSGQILRRTGSGSSFALQGRRGFQKIRM